MRDAQSRGIEPDVLKRTKRFVPRAREEAEWCLAHFDRGQAHQTRLKAARDALDMLLIACDLLDEFASLADGGQK